MVNNNMTKKDLLIELETLRARIVQLEKQPKIPEEQSNKTIPQKTKDIDSESFSRIFFTPLKKYFAYLPKVLDSTQKLCKSTLIRIKGFISSKISKVKNTIKLKNIRRLYRIARIVLLKTMRRLKPVGNDIKKLSIKLYRARWGQITIESILALPLILILSFFAAGNTWFLFPEAIIAWVVLIMALVVFQIAEENRRQQHEQLKREENKHIISEIEKWAKESTRYSMLCRLDGNVKKHEYLVELNLLNISSNNMIEISSSIDESLSKLVKKAAEILSSNVKREIKSDWANLEHACIDIVTALSQYKIKVDEPEKVG